MEDDENLFHRHQYGFGALIWHRCQREGVLLASPKRVSLRLCERLMRPATVIRFLLAGSPTWALPVKTPKRLGAMLNGNVAKPSGRARPHRTA